VAARITVLRLIGRPGGTSVATTSFNQPRQNSYCFNAGVDARAQVVVFAATLVLGAATASDSRSAPGACAGFPQTPGQIGGIHYRRSPLRHDVVFAGLSGTRLTLQGLVLSTSCRPFKGARIDFWQADTNGHYDDAGTRLRSHQFTDARGRYHLETILPGPYPGRTRHMHVKVRAPGQQTLTTELYFPGALYNDRDPYFDKRLLVHLAEVHKTLVASFDFVLLIH
jgi:protocatechuate 3,4-dioxygenase beta subunit